MRIAFYAPLKPPDHPVPSGDRRIARLFLAALTQAGHDVRVASTFRSFDPAGDDEGIAAAAAAEADAIAAAYRAGDWAPELWFTYHLFHKAPDHLGPPVSTALGIPYVVAEASYAPKQAGGPWDQGHRAVAAALGQAAAVVQLNPIDQACVQPLLRPGAAQTVLRPFLDLAPFRQAAADRAHHRQALAATHGLEESLPWLLAVGMMRAGDKSASYGVLADALARTGDRPWRLIVVGDGPAVEEVKARFAPIADRILFVGEQPTEALPAFYAAADLFVWPGVNEALGMAVLEAQAAGAPAVVGRAGALDQIVRDGKTGFLVDPEDAEGFAERMARVLDDGPLRTRLGSAAAQASADHDIGPTSAALDAVLQAALQSHRS